MMEFKSPKAFAAHLLRLAAVGHEVVHRIADRCGETVADTAKEEIGHYQQAFGPYPAWAPLADSTEEDKARNGYPPGAPLLRTGDMRDSIGRTTLGDTVVVGSTDPTMQYHEFGTPKMPPRPVLGLALFRNKNKLIADAGHIVAAWLSGLSWKRASATHEEGRTHD